MRLEFSNDSKFYFNSNCQGLVFPVKIDWIRYEGKNVVATSYHVTSSSELSIFRDEIKDGWLSVWNSSRGYPERQHILTFSIIDMYSLVENAISITCHSTLRPDPLNVQLHFYSSDDVKTFRYYEIFVKNTPILSDDELSDYLSKGQWAVSTGNTNCIV